MIDRLRNAWWALRGVLPAAVVEEVTKIEVRYLPEPSAWRNYYHAQWGYGPSAGAFYLTCEQAHQAHPGTSVSVVLGFEVEGQVYIAPKKLIPIEVQPKPKIPKGKRNGR